MKRDLKEVWAIIKESYIEFVGNKAMRMSAALAYYTVLSIAPMLIIIISLCNIFYGKAAIEGSIYNHIQAFVGRDTALQIEMVVSLGFILLVSLVVNSALDIMGQQLLKVFPEITVSIAYIINLLITFITISLLFAIISITGESSQKNLCHFWMTM